MVRRTTNFNKMTEYVLNPNENDLLQVLKREEDCKYEVNIIHKCTDTNYFVFPGFKFYSMENPKDFREVDGKSFSKIRKLIQMNSVVCKSIVRGPSPQYWIYFTNGIEITFAENYISIEERSTPTWEPTSKEIFDRVFATCTHTLELINEIWDNL